MTFYEEQWKPRQAVGSDDPNKMMMKKKKSWLKERKVG